MIGYISGKVEEALNGNVLLLNNGMGWEVTCSSAAFSRLASVGEGGVYTYMAVRDDGVFLYGFDTKTEKNMFLKLITVSGVGPKMGITVLSGMSLSSLALAIASSDVKALSKIKGLGKKTAERIILELREKITKEDAGDGEYTQPLEEENKVEVNEDAVIALMAYGYSRPESVKAVESAMKNGATSIEQILMNAIRGM